MKTRSKLSVLFIAGGLAFGMAACEADGTGTSPGVEEPAIDDTGTDPLAPAEGEGEGLGEG